VVEEQDPKLLEPFIVAAQELAQEGVRAITTTCGFLVIFQREMAAAVRIPVFTSSLLQIPSVYRMLRPDQKVAVMTGSSRTLHRSVLKAAGADDVPVVVAGLDDSREYVYARYQMNQLDPEKARAEVLSAAQKLLVQEPNVGAFVLECANLPPYSKALRDATGLPVFDIVTLTKWVYSSLVQQEYQGYM
jgi:hypothetical protein